MKPHISIIWQPKPNLYEGDISYGQIQTDFGPMFAAETAQGLCQLSFITSDNTHSNPAHDNSVQTALRDLEAAWPKSFYHHRALQRLPQKINLKELLQCELNLHLCATDFQSKVWQALLAIPGGKVATYSGIAKLLHNPRASQAVGQAVAANPVAVLLPCHRVIKANGVIGNYHWGLALKQRLLETESLASKKPLL